MPEAIVLPVKVDTKKAVESIKTLSIAVTGMNQAFQLATAAVNGLSSAFSKTLGSAIALERQVAEVTTLLGKQAGAQKKITNEVLELQEQFGGETATIAKAFYQAISSGAVEAADTQKLLIKANKLAIGGITSLDTAVDGLTSIISAYGMSVDDADFVSDALFIAMKAGKTTVDELSRHFSKAGTLASQMSIGVDELLSGVAALTTTGAETSEVFTQMKAAMVSLAKPTVDLQKLYDKLNITSIKSQIEQDGMVGTLKKLIAETDGSTESMLKLFSSQESVLAIAGLTSKTLNEKFNKSLAEMGKAAKNAGAVTEEAYQLMAEKVGHQLDVLEGIVNASMTRIGLAIKEVLTPALAGVLVLLTKTTEGFKFLGKAIDTVDIRKLADDFKYFGTILGGLAIVSMSSQLGKLATGFKALALKLAAPAKAMALLAAKALLVTAAFLSIASFIEVFVRNLDLLALRAKATGAKLGLAIIKPMKLISEAALATAKTLNAIGLVSDEALAKVRKRAIEVSNDFANMQSEIDIMEKAYKEASKSIEEGFIANAIKAGIDAVQDFNSELEETVKKAGEVKTVLDGVGGAVAGAGGAGDGAGDGGAAGAGSGGAGDPGVGGLTDFSGKEIAETTGNIALDILKKSGEAILEVANIYVGVISDGAKQQRANMDEIADIDDKLVAARIAGVKKEEKEYRDLIAQKKAAEEKLIQDQIAGAQTVATASVGAIAEVFIPGAGAFVSEILSLAQDPEAVEMFATGIAEAMPTVVSALIDALPVVLRALVDNFPALINAIIDALPAITEALAEAIVPIIVALSKATLRLFFKLPEIFLSVIKGAMKGLMDEVFGDLILDMDKVAMAFSWVAEKLDALAGKLSISSSGGLFGGSIVPGLLADGGVIPAGFPNDSYPALMTSGEMVLNKEQQNAINEDRGRVESMLGQLIQGQNQPIQVSTTLTINEEAFGNIILDLNRDNRRLA